MGNTLHYHQQKQHGRWAIHQTRREQWQSRKFWGQFEFIGEYLVATPSWVEMRVLTIFRWIKMNKAQPFVMITIGERTEDEGRGRGRIPCVYPPLNPPFHLLSFSNLTFFFFYLFVLFLSFCLLSLTLKLRHYMQRWTAWTTPLTFPA